MLLKQTDVPIQILAGSAAAVFETTLTYPFEFLKTGFQLHRRTVGAKPFEALRPIKVYFAGCTALNLSAIVKTSVRFATFDKACQILRDPNLPKDSLLKGPRLLLAGILTGAVESLCIIPFENVKVTMIENSLQLSESKPTEKEIAGTLKKKVTFHVAKPKQLSPQEQWRQVYSKYPSSNIFSVVKEIYLTRGLRGFAQGAMPTVFRQVSNSTVRFTAYTTLKQLISPTQPLNEVYAFGIGLFSSCAVVALTQPIDVVKTRMQSKTAHYFYKNSLNCAYRVFVEEGMVSLWKGWLPRLFKVGLSGGISFGVYQYVENLSHTLKKEKYFD